MDKTQRSSASTWRNAFLVSAMLSGTCGAAYADTLGTVTQAVNIFTSGPVTGGAPFTVDVGGPTAIVPGTEFVAFAFGTYDVDVSPTSLSMTFVNDPASLGIAIYDSTTVDQYFFEFDSQIASASILDAADGFAATVDVIAPGSTASSVGSFVDGLATSFTFDTGGILISFGEGTNLNTVGTGGSITIGLAAVPLPASLPALLVGVGAFGLLRKRRSTRKN